MSAVGNPRRIVDSGAVTPGSTSQTTTAVAAASVGDCLIVGFRAGAGHHVTAVTDSAGNTYTLLDRTTTSNTCSVFYSILTVAITTSTTLTITWSNSPTSAVAYGVAFSNVDSITPIGSKTSASTTSSTTFSVTGSAPLRHGSMLVAVVTLNEGSNPTVTSGSLSQVTASPWIRLGYRQNDDLNAYSLTFGGPTIARNWACVLAEINRVPSDFLNL